MKRVDKLLLVNGILTALYAVMLLFTPGQFFDMRGLEHTAAALFVTRLLGGPAQIGYAVLSIVASRRPSEETRRLVCVINAITWSSGLIILATGALTLRTTGLIYMDIAVALVFSLAFAIRVLRGAKQPALAAI